MWFTKRKRAQWADDYETWVEGGVSPTLSPFDNTGGTRATVLNVLSFDSTFSEYSRINVDVSPPVKPGSGLGIPSPPAVWVPGPHVRRLTPLECERLMGWPDNHTLNRADGTENDDTNRYKMCGNGVVAPVAKWIAGHINATA